MSDCTSPTVELDTASDVVAEVPVETPVVILLGSSSAVEVATNGAEIIIDGNPADEVVEVMTKTKGDKGDKGDPGPRGLTGNRGVPGPEGIRGRDGEQGIRGFRGPAGSGGGAGPAGQPGPPGEIDSELLLELVQPMLNEAALIPISEIRTDIGELPDNILDSFLGDLAGTDQEFSDWAAGDEEGHWVGTVSVVSMISEKDYNSYKTATTTLARVSDSMGAIRIEQKVIAEAGRATASQLTTFVAETGNNIAAITQQLTTTTTQAYSTALALTQLSAVTDESLAQMTERIELMADEVEATTTALTQYIAENNGNVALIETTIEAQATAISANASQITALSTTVGDQQSDIAELYDLVADAGTGEIAANYQLKTQVTDGDKVVMTGMALGAAIGENGDYRSEIIFMADTIGFMTKNTGVVHQPFVFDVANDTARLNNVFIGNASIGSAKFSDWLESDTLVSGVPILRMNFRTGRIEATNIKARGDIEATSIKADAANIVKTLNVAGDLFVVPRNSQYVAGSLRAGLHNLCQVSLNNLPSGSKTLLQVRLQYEKWSGDTWPNVWYVNILRNNSVIYSIDLINTNGEMINTTDMFNSNVVFQLPMRSIVDSPPLDNATYTLQLDVRDSGIIRRINGELTVQTTKKGA